MVEKSKEEQDKTHEENKKRIADLKTECTGVNSLLIIECLRCIYSFICEIK